MSVCINEWKRNQEKKNGGRINEGLNKWKRKQWKEKNVWIEEKTREK